MIKDFLIISFTGDNDSIGLRVNNNFFIKKFQTNIKNNKLVVKNIFDFIKKKNGKIVGGIGRTWTAGPEPDPAPREERERRAGSFESRWKLST